jgi:glycogen phosphorylase
VSALHGEVSRRLFQDLYRRWPTDEVPVIHVTNGVHTPTWDSEAADRLWEAQCGKARWLGDLTDAALAMARVGDDQLWACRTDSRRALVASTRDRLTRQLAVRGATADAVAGAARVLDPDALTLGFARRFTAFKRPTLLLRDRARLVRLLTDRDRPVQLLVAGKAHPVDEDGKRMVQEWVALAQDPLVRDRLVFLEDYDLTVAQELVRGVDVWINTPRRPWEACGTSGMKVLVNGGLNVSERDGWWAEAYAADVGWAIDDGEERAEAEADAKDAKQLYGILENEIVPEFYARDARGLPTRWLARVRASMCQLAPRFSANRMVREYLDRLYVPATDRFRERSRDGARLARELARWADQIDRAWSGVALHSPNVRAERDGYFFSVGVDLGGLDPLAVHVELRADPTDHEGALRIPMQGVKPGDGPASAVYGAFVATTRPASHFTPRAVPFHPHACIPVELPRIRWER